MYKIILFLFISIFTCNSQAQTLYFPPNGSSSWDTLSPSTLHWCQQNIDSMYAYLDTSNTKAFILLKDGKIVLEKYFNGQTPNSPWQWASAGKTITSFMVGIAQQENLLSIFDTTSTYLGQGWTSCTTAQEEKIRIIDQLSMTSGLEDGVPDPHCTLDSCLVYKANAGTRWAYHNGPYTLLDSVIQSATGFSLNAYTTQKLKNPTGMTGSFIPLGFNNVFYSTARSMARFGLLMLGKGKWNGVQVMTDTNYYQQMIESSQTLNKSYGYLWWLNGKASFMVPSLQVVFPGSLIPDAPLDMFSALGKDGQLLNIVPSLNMIWLRMGESTDNVAVPYLLNNEIWKYINKLPCTSLPVQQLFNQKKSVQLFPNPCMEKVQCSVSNTIEWIEIYDVQGKRIQRLQPSTHTTFTIDTHALHSGIYFMHVKQQHLPKEIVKLYKD